MHILTDAIGRPFVLAFTPGNVSEIRAAESLISNLRGVKHLIADKSYDANAFRKALCDQGARPVIPGRSNRKRKIAYDKARYRERHLVENAFCALKIFVDLQPDMVSLVKISYRRRYCGLSLILDLISMPLTSLGAARIFASHYQIVICHDPKRIVSEIENWNDEKVERGFAGVPAFRMVGTEADLNDHWVELVLSETPPKTNEWQRITCVDFSTPDGAVYVMSVIDNEPPISIKVRPGDYTAYFAAQNLGIDQLSLGELNNKGNAKLTDEQLAARKDLEWYRIYLVPGRPKERGRIVDRDQPIE